MSKRVLIVEDAPFMQSVLKKILEKHGFKTGIVSSGTEALEVITEEDYDLILLDCQLPILSGYEVASEVRDREKNGHISKRNIIVACTANSMEGDREKCIAAGMDDHLVKPVTEDTLISTIKRWLKI